MYSALLKSLNIENREAGMVTLLVLQSFFIGIFFAALEISSTALFMEQYGEEQLGKAFLLSGIMGMILTGIFSSLQSRIKYSTLVTLTAIITTILTAAMWASFYFTDWEWLVFVIFSLMGALYILSIVAFSGMAGRLFTLRQGKRLFSIIDSGLVFGMILISIAVPFILKVVPEIKDLILISAVSIFASLITQSITSSKYNLNADESEAVNSDEAVETVGLGRFLKNRYIRLLALFVMLSMVTLFFTSYNFLSSGKMSYPDPSDFAIFLANFTIAVMAFSFILKTFVYSKLIKTYGLKVSLLVTPLLVAFFVLIASVVGTIFGYEEETASFVIFFLLLALVRFFSINLKDSIQTPSLRLLFQPIDQKIRYNVQAKVEGLVNEFSAVLSGLLLALLGTLSFMELLDYSYILLFIVGAWVYITFQLYNEYQAMLRKSLVEYKSQKVVRTNEKEESVQLADDKISALRIQRSLDLMKEYEPTLFDNRLDQMLRDSSVKSKELAIKTIDEAEIYGAIKELGKIAKEDKDTDVRKMAEEVKSKLEQSYKDYLKQEKIVSMAKSKNESDRIKAAKIIGDSGNHDYTSLLKNLLRDLSPAVKLQAINSAAKFGNGELWPFLIEQLNNDQFRAAAKSAIESVGDPIMEHLERAYYKSGAELDLLLAIVDLYGRINGEKSVKYLLKKLNDPNRPVVLKALNSLRNLNFSAEDETIQSQIFQAIEQNVALAAWNLAAKFDVEEQGIDKFLGKALEEELAQNNNMIFLLLCLVYDPQSIQHIRENIESGTTEGVSFAIEMLDLFVAEQLKPVLFALLEDNKADDKIKELELHFPINVYGNSDVLLQIMNRSANYLSNYTRACAVYTFLELSKEEQVVSNSIVANLFNNDPLLSETSAIVMNKLDKKAYDAAKERLTDEKQEHLEAAITRFEENTFNASIEKVRFLNTVKDLEHGDNRMIEDLAIHLIFGKANAGDVLIESGKENKYYFIVEGKAECNLASGTIEFVQRELLNDMFILDTDPNDTSVKASSELSYLSMSDSTFKHLLFKYPSLGDLMLQTFDKRMSRNVDVT